MTVLMKSRHRRQYIQSGMNLDLIDDLAWLWFDEALDTTPIVWTDHEVTQIFHCLLEQSLRALADSRVSPKPFQEIMKWVKNYHDPNPFSFENCCLICGVDADEVRDQTVAIAKAKTIKQQHH